MPDLIKDTEAAIESSEFFGARKLLLTGRGATALMLLFETLGNVGGRVILPAIGCPSLLATSLLAGLTPVIVDVDSNLNIDPAEVRKVIKPGDIVLGVHIFGIPCSIEELAEICDENSAYLIEDVAQAVGGVTGNENRPLGTFGKASILSFAKGKILDTHGGGAVLTDDEKLYDALMEKIAKLPERPVDLTVKSIELRDTLTDAFDSARNINPDAASVWSDVYNRNPEIYSYSISDSEASWIKNQFEKFPKNVGDRIDGVRLYESRLDSGNIEFLEYPGTCVPYRFSFIMSNLSGSQTQELTEAIRNATPDGIHASNLYLPLHWLAPDLVVTNGCPRAEFAAVRVINLWLTDKIPTATVDIVREIISHYIQTP